MISIGIDIAGAHGKRFDLAIVRWGSTLNTASHVTWGTLPLGHPNTGYPIFHFARIATACRLGNFSQIATLSYPIALFVSRALGAQLANAGVDISSSVIVAIDSPSGFSRNIHGHGRATEKVGRHFGLSGAHHQPYFQMSPSIACNRLHGNRWAWMLFGMGTFFAFSCRFNPSPSAWEDFLRDGFASVPGGLGGNLLEVFPRATIQYARYSASTGGGTIGNLRQIIGSLQNAAPETNLILQSLQTGKKTGSDRADALIAALTTLGKIYPYSFTMTALQHGNPSNYFPLPPDWIREGVIYTVS
jgi:hypothetical protein